MEIRAFAQSPEHSTLSTVNGSENGLPNPLCATDFKTSAVADEQGDADSLVARGATDWLVGGVRSDSCSASGYRCDGSRTERRVLDHVHRTALLIRPGQKMVTA